MAYMFSALPVKVGDAFLLRSPLGTVLVDAGKNRRDILKLLKQEHLTNHINLLVCTHYDADHIRGILGVLESGNYAFDEIWLPEVLGSLSYTISEKLMDILNRLRELNGEGITNLLCNTLESSKNKKLFSIPEESPIKTADLENLKNYLVHYTYHAFRLGWQSNSAIPGQAMLANLSAAITAVLSSQLSGAHVRWFKYSQALTNKCYGFGMYAMNSNETAVTLFSPDVFLKQLYLTTVNNESLVFKFSCGKKPEILFCADSDLSFANTRIRLNDKSIVTAPHHGASDCDKAYNLVEGNDFIYVRSDQSQTKRPGNGFLTMTHRYCTVCRTMGPKQKVEITYTGRNWRVKVKKCKCDI